MSPSASIFPAAPRSTITATPTTSAPASRSAVDGREHRATGGGGVLDGEHPPAGDVRALDAPLQAVRLALLADDERVQPAAARGGGVQHRGRDRVGAEREPADRVEVEVVGQVEHDLADQRRRRGVEGDAAQVDVVVGLPPRGQHDLAVHDRLVRDLGQQVVAGRSWVASLGQAGAVTSTRWRRARDHRARAQPADRPGGVGAAAGGAARPRARRGRGRRTGRRRAAVRRRGTSPGRPCRCARPAAAPASRWSGTRARATCCRCSAPPGERPAHPVAAYVFLDAGLPPGRPTSRLDLMRAEAPEVADELAATARRRRPVPGLDRRRPARAGAGRRGARGRWSPGCAAAGADFFTETLPVAPDWPDALCGFLRLSPGYDSAARVAGLRGWPCVLGPDDRPGGHFAALVDPGSGRRRPARPCSPRLLDARPASTIGQRACQAARIRCSFSGSMPCWPR